MLSEKSRSTSGVDIVPVYYKGGFVDKFVLYGEFAPDKLLADHIPVISAGKHVGEQIAFKWCVICGLLLRGDTADQFGVLNISLKSTEVEPLP
ncbi:hypothetical protein LJB87_00640 [Alistipes sp. OttesenSCG-928-L06]|nr:hypothetical protein [Alistipes sp. OttesenSCG-928-L06]